MGVTNRRAEISEREESFLFGITPAGLTPSEIFILQHTRKIQLHAEHRVLPWLLLEVNDVFFRKADVFFRKADVCFFFRAKTDLDHDDPPIDIQHCVQKPNEWQGGDRAGG